MQRHRRGQEEGWLLGKPEEHQVPIFRRFQEAQRRRRRWGQGELGAVLLTSILGPAAGFRGLNYKTLRITEKEKTYGSIIPFHISP